MKKLLLLLTVFFALTVAQGQTTFQKTYGGVVTDGSWSVQQTSDGGYIITAEGGGSLLNLKTDSAGTIVWAKNYSISYGNMITETFDGGYIVTGLGNYLMKTDSAGNVLWTKTYAIGEGWSVQQTSDSGFIMVGLTSSYGAGQADVYLVKTDTIGDTLWTKTYGGISNEGINGYGNISVQQTPGGGYIINGYTDSFGAGNYDFYVIKTDAFGNVLWSKTFGGSSVEYGYGNSTGLTGDNSYIMVGRTESFGAGAADVYLVKMTASGNILWSKTYGGTSDDYGYSVQQTAGGYIIAGATSSFGAQGENVYLIKTDMNGNLIWSKTFGGISQDQGYSVDNTTDGGYVITGYTMSFGSGGYDVYLIKTDANGNSGCNDSNAATIVTNPPTITTTPLTLVSSGASISTTFVTQSSGTTTTNLCSSTSINEISGISSFSIYPNPFSTQTTLKTDRFCKDATMTVYNSLGQQVKQMKNISGQTIILNRDNLPSGLYFVRLTEENKIIAVDKLEITD